MSVKEEILEMLEEEIAQARDAMDYAFTDDWIFNKLYIARLNALIEKIEALKGK